MTSKQQDEFLKYQLIIKSQLTLYPEAHIEDLYKLTYQASMGSEHAIKNPEGARDWLIRELAELNKSPSVPLFEDISPYGIILRLNLAPYMDIGGDPEALLDAFLKTANEFTGNFNKLAFYWSGIVELAVNGEINFDVTELKDFHRQLSRQGYPVIHHSIPYRNAYHPHYRVISRQSVHQAIPGLLG